MTLRPMDFHPAAVGERRWAVHVELRSMRVLNGQADVRAAFYSDSPSLATAIDEVWTLLQKEEINTDDVIGIEVQEG